jgi:nucleolar protein 56
MALKELRALALKRVKKKVSEEKFKRDHLIIQSVECIDEIDEVINLMMERVRNWYAFHYPELSRLVKSPDAYLLIIKEIKSRRMMMQDRLEPFTGPDMARKIASIATQTMGADLDEKDLKRIAGLASLTLDTRKEREELAQYVENSMREMAPNLHSMVGGMLAARLMAKAGSLERMAEMPASTIQVLGAEKALFAHLRTGVKPPKHGVIFAYPAVQQAPKDRRGRVARVLANHLAIAARVDFFRHTLQPELKQGLDKAVQHALQR